MTMSTLKPKKIRLGKHILYETLTNGKSNKKELNFAPLISDEK